MKIENGNEPWNGNPNITLQQVWESRKEKQLLPVPDAQATQAADLMIQGVAPKEIAKQLGYKESAANKLVHSLAVQAKLKKALEDAGVTDKVLGEKIKSLMNAKRTEFAKFKGDITDSREVDDNGTQLAATSLAIDVFTEFSTKKSDKGGPSQPQFVIQLGNEFKNIFFPGSEPPQQLESQNAQEPDAGYSDPVEQVQSGSHN